MKPITLFALMLLFAPTLLARNDPPPPPPQDHDNDKKGRLIVGAALAAIGLGVYLSWDAKPKERVQFGIEIKPGEK